MKPYQTDRTPSPLAIYAQERRTLEDALDIICQWIATQPIVHTMPPAERLRLFHLYIQKHGDDYTREQREGMASILKYAGIE